MKICNESTASLAALGAGVRRGCVRVSGQHDVSARGARDAAHTRAQLRHVAAPRAAAREVPQVADSSPPVTV